MEQISLKEFKLIKLNIFFNFKFQIYENFQVFEFINIFTKLSNITKITRFNFMLFHQINNN